MFDMQEWAEAQDDANSPDDWLNVDSLAAALFKDASVPRLLTKEAVRLAIERKGASTDEPISPGDPADCWDLHFLQAIWRGLDAPIGFKEIFFSLPMISHSIDSDGRLLAVTSQWCETMARSPDDVIGRRSSDFLTEESQKLALEVYLPQFWRDGCICKAAYDFVTGAGKIKPMYLSGLCEYDSVGKPQRSFAILCERD